MRGESVTPAPGATAGRPHARGVRPVRVASRILFAGPGQVRPPAVRLVVYLLAAAGVVLTVWSGVIHIRLWSEGYEAIPTIGPLFLAQGVGSLVIAAALVVIRRVVVMAIGAASLAATAVGLLLSVYVGLFGYRESLAVPDARTSLVIEFSGAAVLLLAAVIVAVAAVRGAEPGR